jgi:hypothetical protein
MITQTKAGILDQFSLGNTMQIPLQERGKTMSTQPLTYEGVLAGAVVADNVAKFAQSNGMYVITQSGETFEIVQPPKGFIAKRW